MNSVRIALIAGSALLLAVGGVSVVACGSDDNTGFPVGKADASMQNNNGSDSGDNNTGDDNADTGANSTPDSGNGGDDNNGDDGTDSGNNGDDSTDAGGSTDAHVAADCGSLAIPSSTEKNYCFSHPTNADSNGTCSGTKPACCDLDYSDGGFGNSCIAATGACTAPTAADKAYFFGCGQAGDCTTGKCYLYPYADSDGGSIFIGGACGYVPLASGSACYASLSAAPSGSTPTCLTDSDCTSGVPSGNTKCNPVKIHGKYFGACTTP